jgi:hypothetical protein
MIVVRWLTVAGVVCLWLLAAFVVALAALSLDELWRVVR